MKEKKIRTIAVVGLQTDYCIDATIKCGFAHGLEKMSGTSQESYDISMREKYLYMQEYIKDFMDVLEGNYA